MRDRNENKITFILIRHGMTTANEERRFLGITDIGLSDSGACEIRNKWPEAPETGLVFSSPMKRCTQTALEIWKDMDISDLMIIPEWREIDFGSFEMKNHEELKSNPDYQAWIDSAGSMQIPGGESRNMFTRRVLRGLMTACRECASRRVSLAAAVAHGGTIMALLSGMGAGDYYDFLCPNGSGFVADISFTGDLQDIKLERISKIGEDR